MYLLATQLHNNRKNFTSRLLTILLEYLTGVSSMCC